MQPYGTVLTIMVLILRMPMLFVIVGILVTLMIIGACVTATLAIRRRRMKKLAEIDIIRCSPSTDQDEQVYIDKIITLVI
jgi:hypothetical protein